MKNRVESKIIWYRRHNIVLLVKDKRMGDGTFLKCCLCMSAACICLSHWVCGPAHKNTMHSMYKKKVYVFCYPAAMFLTTHLSQGLSKEQSFLSVSQSVLGEITARFRRKSSFVCAGVSKNSTVSFHHHPVTVTSSHLPVSPLLLLSFPSSLLIPPLCLSPFHSPPPAFVLRPPLSPLPLFPLPRLW